MMLCLAPFALTSPSSRQLPPHMVYEREAYVILLSRRIEQEHANELATAWKMDIHQQAEMATAVIAARPSPAPSPKILSVMATKRTTDYQAKR